MPCIYRGSMQLKITQTFVSIIDVTNSINKCCMFSPRASVLLRCGEGDGEGGEGTARLVGGCPKLVSPVLVVTGTAGEAEDEEVGRFWKYCSPGSSSSKPPHGYTCRYTEENPYQDHNSYQEAYFVIYCIFSLNKS